VGKLVLLLADGKRAEFLLDRERITIGRRADNDICLPQAAVSNEHAAIVNVLSDSYVEDLGSTNGTLVNRTPVTTRQLLRDGDEIDIGRQRLVYLSDNNAAVAAATVPLPSTPARRDSDRVGSPPGRRSADSSLAESLPGEASAENRHAAFAAPPYPVSAPVPEDASPTSIRDIDRFVATEVAAGCDTDPDRVDDTDDVESDSVSPTANASAVDAPHTDLDAEASLALPIGASPVLRVRSGLGAGRSVALFKDETTIGRIGVQTAAIRRDGDGLRMVQIEGSQPPRVNGVPVPASGTVLRSGDVIEIAGARAELEFPEDPAT
jgi:predicted component of type VI protein secretion system